MDVMRTLDFHFSKYYLYAFFPIVETTEEDFIKIKQDMRSRIWNVEIYYKNKKYSQEHTSLYNALDAANDWWFHEQRNPGCFDRHTNLNSK